MLALYGNEKVKRGAFGLKCYVAYLGSITCHHCGGRHGRLSGTAELFLLCFCQDIT